MDEALADEQSPASLLLELPNPCLMAVLQLCAKEQRSLFSAARAHSRLHQAVVALSSFTAVVPQQQQLDGVYSYLNKHGQHLDSISLEGHWDGSVSLRELPAHLQLSSMQLGQLCLQLLPTPSASWGQWQQLSGRGAPYIGHRGVLSNAATSALKQLRLNACQLIDGYEGLAAALPIGLEHLSIVGARPTRLQFAAPTLGFPTKALEALQQLTFLQLGNMCLQGPDRDTPTLQTLQALTRLVDLRIDASAEVRIHARMLSSMCCLTHLRLHRCKIEQGTLAGRTQLQHVSLVQCEWADGAAWLAQMLSYLQHMQQLTHLCLDASLKTINDTNPPAAAFSALTASSKLQHLGVNSCMLPEGVWHHVFPSGRQLPHLRSLNISRVQHPPLPGDRAAAPEGSRLVSCCPGLHFLNMEDVQYCYDSGKHLGQTNLDTGVCLLTELRELSLSASARAAGLLLQLTQLQNLTRLEYSGPSSDGYPIYEIFDARVS